MESNPQNMRDIVDTTDSLEAVGACRSMKNFLFFVILIGLLLPQLFFWLNWMGLIEKKASTPCGAGQLCPVQKQICPAAEEKPQAAAVAPIGLLPLAATVDVTKEEVEKVTEQAAQSTPPAEPATGSENIIEKPADTTQAEMPADKTDTQPKEEDKISYRIPCHLAGITISICNFLVIMGTILYCLTLLMCLKISLTGRLGGVSHLTKAFFISLFLMVIVFPWQQILPGILIGTVWLPRELFCGGWTRAQTAVVWKILFYLRFCGLWFLAIWFLFWAQVRTGKWARATLRRLGVVR